jgi:hypothetical protein
MVSVIGGDDGLGGASAGSCAGCGSQLAAGQRYCLSCGERRGALPAAVAEWLSIVPPRPEAEPAAESAAAAVGGASASTEPDGEDLLTRYMPEPRAAAIAVMALLAFGVVVGAATGPVARGVGLTPIVVYMEPEPVEEEAEPVEEVEAVEPPPVATVSGEETPLVPTGLEGTGPPTTTPTKKPLELPEEEILPPIAHVFAIVLGDNGYETAFGDSSPAPYLAKTLREKGELLPNYYAVTQGDLANEIALVSGQGPNPATVANCPERTDLPSGSLDASGQGRGEGCVYPAEVQSLPDLLAASEKSWKVYAGDPHSEWRNPFGYFHSLSGDSRCADCEAGIDQLSADLTEEDSTPSFSYIVPGACEDGSEAPCEAGRPAGLAATQPFLERVVPEIEASDAYKKGGLIAITFAQAPQGGPEADTSACCSTAEYPNLPPSPPAPPTNSPVKETGGGGRVGMLLLSPFVQPGSVNETGYYNHFSFLLSVEELLGLSPPLGYAADSALTAFDSSVFNLGE